MCRGDQGGAGATTIADSKCQWRNGNNGQPSIIGIEEGEIMSRFGKNGEMRKRVTTLFDVVAYCKSGDVYRWPYKRASVANKKADQLRSLKAGYYEKVEVVQLA